MLNIKEVIKNNEILKGIKYNLLGNELFDKFLKEIDNSIKNIILGNYVLENRLHYSKNKNKYLFESRLFTIDNEMMVNSYLEIFDNNINILEDYIDNVWEYADDWEEV